MSALPPPAPTYAPGRRVVEASYAPNPSSPQPMFRGPMRSITSGNQIGSGKAEPELGLTPSTPKRNSSNEKLYPAPTLKPSLEATFNGPLVGAVYPSVGVSRQR